MSYQFIITILIVDICIQTLLEVKDIYYFLRCWYELCFILANINKELPFSYWLLLYIYISVCLCGCIANFLGMIPSFLAVTPKCITRFGQQNCDLYVSYNKYFSNPWILGHWFRCLLIRTQFKCKFCIKIFCTMWRFSLLLVEKVYLEGFSDWLFLHLIA